MCLVFAQLVDNRQNHTNDKSIDVLRNKWSTPKWASWSPRQRRTKAAPSLTPLALPAVTVPWPVSSQKAGFKRPSPSIVVSGRGNSSLLWITGSVHFLMVGGIYRGNKKNWLLKNLFRKPQSWKRLSFRIPLICTNWIDDSHHHQAAVRSRDRHAESSLKNYRCRANSQWTAVECKHMMDSDSTETWLRIWIRTKQSTGGGGYILFYRLAEINSTMLDVTQHDSVSYIFMTLKTKN